jgi:uncharacterized protein YjbI with pentapeptide repeats
MDRSSRSRRASQNAGLRHAGLAFLVSLVAGTSSALAQDEAPPEPVQPETQEIGLLFTQTADHGRLSHPKGNDSSRFNLVLKGASPQVVWFQDRPGRQSGHISTRSFARTWASFGFEEVPPNAALTVRDAPHHRDTVILILGHPRYKAGMEKLVYPARIGDEATGNLAHLESSRDDAVSTRFHEASLFIDDFKAPVIANCVIQPYAQCPSADLSGADLRDADLTGVNLARAKLNRALLTHTNLTHANLLLADLTGVDLTNANLSGADLSHATVIDADLSGATFTNATLARADFTNATFTNATLTNADLTGANLAYADLYNATFTNANLIAVNLTAANLVRANLKGLDIRSSNLPYAALTNANLTDANLARANFTDASLARARLNGTDLRSATLARANLAGADLTGADLSSAYLAAADLTNANLTGVRFCNTVMPDGSRNNEHC